MMERWIMHIKRFVHLLTFRHTAFFTIRFFRRPIHRSRREHRKSSDKPPPVGGGSRDGLLYVLGRFKSLLIASDGEKYSPEGMEEAIVDKSPYIDQIIVHNNQRPFTGAIVVPNREALRRELEARRTPEAERVNVAAEILGAEIDRYRAGGTYAGEFPERWLPAGLAIVDEAFTEQNGLVNSTMKVVRGKVEEHFRNRLDYLYSAEGRSLKNPENLASLKKIVG